MPSMSTEWENPTPTIRRDKTVDEFGEVRYGWFCERCEEGSFHADPDTADLTASQHADSHPPHKIVLVNEKGLAKVRAVRISIDRYRVDHMGRDQRWHEAAVVADKRLDTVLAEYPYRRA